MKVLLVNQYYPPDGAATAVMAEAATTALTVRNHRVVVLAGRPSYDVARSTRWRPVQTNTRGTVTVRRVGSSAFGRGRAAGRLSNYASYAALATPAALAASADVVLGMSDPPFAGVLSGRAARLRRRPFVYWMQDVHPEFALATGDLRPNAAVNAWRRLHERALATADAVVVLGDDMARRAVDAGASPARVHVVRSGARLDAAADDGDGVVAATIRGGTDFVVVHAGNLGQAATWRALIDGVPDGARLVFVGPGTERAAAQQAAAGDNRIAFFDYWPAEEAAQVLRAGDLYAVTVRRGLEGLVVPSRLYSVLAAGRPVLAIADDASDVAVLVRRHACGLVADPDDASSVAAAIEWARAHPAELAEMGRRAAAAAIDYDRDRELNRLVDIVESVVT